MLTVSPLKPSALNVLTMVTCKCRGSVGECHFYWSKEIVVLTLRIGVWVQRQRTQVGVGYSRRRRCCCHSRVLVLVTRHGSGHCGPNRWTMVAEHLRQNWSVVWTLVDTINSVRVTCANAFPLRKLIIKSRSSCQIKPKCTIGWCKQQIDWPFNDKT